MSESEFQEAYEIAKAAVESWPAWKRNWLENASKPTVEVPREFVDNFNGTNDCY